MADGAVKAAVIGGMATVMAAVVPLVFPSVIDYFRGTPKPATLAFSFLDAGQASSPVSSMNVSVDCGKTAVESLDAQGPRYRYKVSPGSSPIDCRIAAKDALHEPIEISLRAAPGEDKDEKISLARRRPGAGAGANAAAPAVAAAASPELARLALEYDSIAAQFSAARGSMAERIKDLGGQPVKPELQAAMDGGQSHLLAAKQAIGAGQAAVASQRLEQVKRAVQLLNSL